MERKFYTIMIIPHARARFRNIRLSQTLVACCAGALVLLALSTLLLPRYLLLSHVQGNSIDHLQAENTRLRAANDRYDQDVAQLRAKLADYEKKAMKFALMAGVGSLPADKLPSGSPGDLPADFSPGSLRPQYLSEEISILMGRAKVLDESYTILDQAYADQAVRLATTPSIAPTKGIMGSGYANRRDPFTGQREFHAGLDIVANAGTEVYATADGVVTRAARLGSYGRAVFVSHGNGFATRYAHLSSVNVKSGQRVKRGDLLGRVGATGRAMGFHLHYEVLLHKRKVDPLQYILDENQIY